MPKIAAKSLDDVAELMENEQLFIAWKQLITLIESNYDMTYECIVQIKEQHMN